MRTRPLWARITGPEALTVERSVTNKLNSHTKSFIIRSLANSDISQGSWRMQGGKKDPPSAPCYQLYVIGCFAFPPTSHRLRRLRPIQWTGSTLPHTLHPGVEWRMTPQLFVNNGSQLQPRAVAPHNFSYFNLPSPTFRAPLPFHLLFVSSANIRS